MNNEYLELSKKYRTIHSIDDKSVELIDNYINIDNVKTFADYGCHFGHLSIYLAKTYNITIYAVDNFVGTINDKLMKETINNTANSNNFYNKTYSNIQECYPLLGNIILQYSENFLNNNIVFDFVFIDSSHRVEEAYEFVRILDKVKKNGLIGGHDFNYKDHGLGVRTGIALIEKQCEWIIKDHTWLMRKIV